MGCCKTHSMASPSYLVAVGLRIPRFSPSVPFFPTCTGAAEIWAVHFCWLHKCDPSRECVWRDFTSDAAWRGPERWEHSWGDRNNIAACGPWGVPSELPRLLTWLFLSHFPQHWWLRAYSVFSFGSLNMCCKPKNLSYGTALLNPWNSEWWLGTSLFLTKCNYGSFTWSRFPGPRREILSLLAKT